MEVQLLGFTTSTANLIIAQMSSVFYTALKGVFLAFWPQLLLFALVFFGYKAMTQFVEWEHADDKDPVNQRTLAAMERQRELDEFHTTHGGADELDEADVDVYL